jgi:benzil reductase ((S)-benzoin forming)
VARNLVIVTGGSSGIGLALLETCPLADARRIDVSRRGAPGCEHLAADLSGPPGWQALAELFARELTGFAGERVVCFHSAGTLSPIGFAGEVDAEAYARSVLLNSAAPQILGDAFLRAAAGTGARCDLVMIGSGAASSVYEGWTGYGAGKAAVNQWVAVAGAEQERRGGRCRVLSVAPGVVATAMQEEIRRTPERDFPDVARFVELHEGGQLRATEDVARDLWGLIDRRDLPNGAVLDLRDAADS